MCGIAGVIYRNGDGEHAVGADMTRMLPIWMDTFTNGPGPE